MEKKLCDLRQNESAVIKFVMGDIHLKRRLLELGLTRGEIVKVLSVSPLKSSFLIAIRDYTLALRKNSLENIFVE